MEERKCECGGTLKKPLNFGIGMFSNPYVDFKSIYGNKRLLVNVLVCEKCGKLAMYAQGEIPEK